LTAACGCGRAYTGGISADWFWKFCGSEKSKSSRLGRLAAIWFYFCSAAPALFYEPPPGNLKSSSNLGNGASSPSLIASSSQRMPFYRYAIKRREM